MSESMVVSEKTTESNSMVNEHMLFGGAFSAVLPSDFQDVSELRQIPDNQEVFTHTRTDQSIIMELLEFQKDIADADAARYHFADIASTNDPGNQGTSEVLSVEPIPKSKIVLAECQTAWFLTGRQMVGKFNEQAKNTVNIYMCLFRLPQFTTDILLTFNDPQVINSREGRDPGCHNHQREQSEEEKTQTGPASSSPALANPPLDFQRRAGCCRQAHLRVSLPIPLQYFVPGPRRLPGSFRQPIEQQCSHGNSFCTATCASMEPGTLSGLLADLATSQPTNLRVENFSQGWHDPSAFQIEE